VDNLGEASSVLSQPAVVIVEVIKYFVMSVSLVPLAIIDFRKHIVPNRILGVLFVCRLIIYVAEVIMYQELVFPAVVSDVLGAVAIGLFFLILALISRNSIGMGDIKLIGIMGLFLGGQTCLLAIFLGLFGSLFASLFFLATKKKTRRDYIPLVPALLGGTVLSVILNLGVLL
jgi:prepilin signal peptidase PulO-like enzyme (type II secretory pathway)